MEFWSNVHFQIYLNRVIYASYGGLMMTLSGSQTDLDKLTLDMPVYLLMRKI